MAPANHPAPGRKSDPTRHRAAPARPDHPASGSRRVLAGVLAAAAVLAAVAASSAPAGASSGTTAKQKSGSATAQLNAISTPYDYLMNRADYMAHGSCSGLYTVPALSMTVTWLNGANGVVGYGFAQDVTYIPASRDPELPIYFPAHFKADHVKMEFSDRSNFNPAQADDIGFDIVFGGSLVASASVTETLHSWGNSKVTFTPKGANDGVLYGDEASTSHTSISLVRWCKDIIR